MRARRLGGRLGTLAEIFRNPQLRRLELAWGGYYLGEWTQFVALSIWAFRNGGATAVGALGLIRMGAAAVALPSGGCSPTAIRASASCSACIWRERRSSRGWPRRSRSRVRVR